MTYLFDIKLLSQPDISHDIHYRLKGLSLSKGKWAFLGRMDITSDAWATKSCDMISRKGKPMPGGLGIGAGNSPYQKNDFP